MFTKHRWKFKFNKINSILFAMKMCFKRIATTKRRWAKMLSNASKNWKLFVLWFCGFLTQRGFDKMIFYFEEQNIFSFQILVFKGHTGVFSNCFWSEMVWSSACTEFTAVKNIKGILNIYVLMTPCCQIFENCYLNYHLLRVIATYFHTMFLKVDFR